MTNFTDIYLFILLTAFKAIYLLIYLIYLFNTHFTILILFYNHISIYLMHLFIYLFIMMHLLTLFYLFIYLFTYLLTYLLLFYFT
jgi:hypothetical protein